MIPKMTACLEAVTGECPKAAIIDGQAPALDPARDLHGCLASARRWCRHERHQRAVRRPARAAGHAHDPDARSPCSRAVRAPGSGTSMAPSTSTSSPASRSTRSGTRIRSSWTPCRPRPRPLPTSRTTSRPSRRSSWPSRLLPPHRRSRGSCSVTRGRRLSRRRSSCRAAPAAPRILALHGAFHGRTTGATALTGKRPCANRSCR